MNQKQVLSYILHYFKKWYELAKTPESVETFTPLRMTLCGVAGSGKSTLVNTLVTVIRKITQKTTSVYVCGPTGLQFSMLVVKHVTNCSTSNQELMILNYQDKP